MSENGPRWFGHYVMTDDSEAVIELLSKWMWNLRSGEEGWRK